MSKRQKRQKRQKRKSVVEMLERRILLDAVPVGAEFQVNTYTTNSQVIPSIATDTNGNFVIVWGSWQQDGSALGVYGQRYNASGVPQGEEFRVNTYTADRQWGAKVAMDADGDFVVVWNSDYQDGSLGGVYAQRYNASGVPQGGEFRVNTWTTSTQEYASVAMDPVGSFIIAWNSFGQDGSGWGVYAQRFDAAGVAQGPEFRVNTHTAGVQLFPSIGTDANGNFVIVWYSDHQGNGRSSVYAQRYDATGTPTGDEFRVNEHTTTFNSRPSVAMDADGDFVIVWQSSLEILSDADLYSQRYNAAGVPQGPEFRVNSATPFDQRLPSIAMDADGNFIVAWESVGPNSLDGYARRFNAGGAALGDEFPVTTFSTSPQLQPSVAMDADGDFIITWCQIREPNSGYDVYAQRYAVLTAPTVGDSALKFETSPHRLTFAFNTNVYASLGTDDLVVENLTTSQTIPADQFALTYDTATNTATFTYLGGGGVVPGLLPDGNYRATLVAAGITNPAGAPMATDHVFDFFFLNGDANRDGGVNLADFNILAANFGQSNRTFSQGDFNYDGVVNLADFNILAGRFGGALARSGASSAQWLFASADDEELLA